MGKSLRLSEIALVCRNTDKKSIKTDDRSIGSTQADRPVNDELKFNLVDATTVSI
jgi:hypothetical protein